MENYSEQKQRFNKIAEFITSVDVEKRLCLLPYSEFLKKYSNHSKEEKLLLLYEFEELYETGMISTEYLSNEWSKIDFGRFVYSMIETIENTLQLKDRMKFTLKTREKFESIIKSDNSIEEKIISMSNLIKNYIQFYGTKQFCNDVLFNDIESELNYLKEIQKQQLLANNRANQKTIVEETSDSKSDNPHHRIFPDGKCWLLFEHWRNDVKARTQLAEFSFIYWQMFYDGLIYENVKPTEFRNWLYKNFNIELDELKQLSNCNGGNKYSRYQTAKLLFQC